jgi:homoserine kinase
MKNKVRVFAPASASNLGPGFDVIGLALPQPGDVVEAEWCDTPGVSIREITGDGGALPYDGARNVAAVAANDVLRRVQADNQIPLHRGISLRLEKQTPLASGLGSSGASAVAGAFATNELLDRPLSRTALVASALAGEQVAAGTAHADNVAPSMLGGIVLIRSYEPLELINLPIPTSLQVVVVHPHCEVSTAAARRLVNERTYMLADAVANLGNLGALVDALHRNDLEQFGRSIVDRLVEPVRAKLIPGLAEVKEAARGCGALGCSISGAGPSLFAFAGSETTAREIAKAMQEAFRDAADLDSDAHIGPVNAQGATTMSTM